MPSGPSTIAEAIVALLTPPACREEVLGDLYERFRSPGQYFLDALRTVPLVILSRVRRTADPRTVTLQGLFLYLSYLAAAWLTSRDLLLDPRSLRLLAIPAGATLLGLILHDAYSISTTRHLRGYWMAVGSALLFYVLMRTSGAAVTIPFSTLIYGCALGFLGYYAIRALMRAADDDGPSTGSRRGSPS